MDRRNTAEWDEQAEDPAGDLAEDDEGRADSVPPESANDNDGEGDDDGSASEAPAAEDEDRDADDPEPAPPPATAAQGAATPLHRPSDAEFRILHRQHAASVWRRLMLRRIPRADAQEIHQEVFLTMYRRLCESAPPENVGGMLATITENKIRNWTRILPFHRGVDHDVDPAELPGGERDPGEQALAAEKKAFVHRVLADMPEKSVLLLTLLDLNRWTHQDVADYLGKPLSTVKSAHARARNEFARLARQRRLYERGGGR